MDMLSYRKRLCLWNRITGEFRPPVKRNKYQGKNHKCRYTDQVHLPPARSLLHEHLIDGIRGWYLLKRNNHRSKIQQRPCPHDYMYHENSE